MKISSQRCFGRDAQGSGKDPDPLQCQAHVIDTLVHWSSSLGQQPFAGGFTFKFDWSNEPSQQQSGVLCGGHGHLCFMAHPHGRVGDLGTRSKMKGFAEGG